MEVIWVSRDVKLFVSWWRLRAGFNSRRGAAGRLSLACAFGGALPAPLYRCCVHKLVRTQDIVITVQKREVLLLSLIPLQKVREGQGNEERERGTSPHSRFFKVKGLRSRAFLFSREKKGTEKRALSWGFSNL